MKPIKVTYTFRGSKRKATVTWFFIGYERVLGCMRANKWEIVVRASSEKWKKRGTFSITGQEPSEPVSKGMVKLVISGKNKRVRINQYTTK